MKVRKHKLEAIPQGNLEANEKTQNPDEGMGSDFAVGMQTLHSAWTLAANDAIEIKEWLTEGKRNLVSDDLVFSPKYEFVLPPQELVPD